MVHNHTSLDNLRPLGDTGVRVSSIALGTAALGGLYEPVRDEVARDTVTEALTAGISYIDTAPQYGHGVAETRLGRALRTVDRESFVVSSKVGRIVVPVTEAAPTKFRDAPQADMVFAFDRSSVMRSIDDSLTRLGLDRLDIIYIHDPDDHVDEAIDVTYPLLHELRAQGVVSAIGVGMNQTAIPTRFVRETDIDVVLLAGRYTLLDQSALVDLIPAAREDGVSIVVGGVFNSGVLADGQQAPTFDYEPASPLILHRVKRLRTICARHSVELRTAALAFPLRERAITSVLIGPRSPEELHQCLATDPITVPNGLWAELHGEGLIHEHDR